MSRIAVWFDGGGPYGFGNVRRSTELGEALVRRGHEVHFVALSERAAALCSVTKSSIEEVDVVVLDVPYAGDALVRQARALGATILALDFDGVEAPDTVLSLQSMRCVPAQSRALCGVEYAIIREEILECRRARQSTMNDRTPRSGERTYGSNEVLIIVGGGDQDGLTQRIVERLPDVPICVVQGPAGAPLNLERQGLRVVMNPPELPQLMADCAWAVTTGGTTMLEMLCLGKAIHVVARTEAERVFSERFAEQGALLGMGLESLTLPEIKNIIACQQRGPQLVDGKGCERIAIEIENLL